MEGCISNLLSNSETLNVEKYVKFGVSDHRIQGDINYYICMSKIKYSLFMQPLQITFIQFILNIHNPFDSMVSLTSDSIGSNDVRHPREF